MRASTWALVTAAAAFAVGPAFAEPQRSGGSELSGPRRVAPVPGVTLKGTESAETEPGAATAAEKRPPKVILNWGKGFPKKPPPLEPDGLAGPKTERPGPRGAAPPSIATPGQHGAGQANLVVELITPVSSPEGLPGTGMCAEAPPSGGPSHQVRFRVRNTGTAAAEPSKTAVHWTGPNDFAWMNLVDTYEIQPGGASNTYVNLPPGCFGLAAHGSCQFLVEVDRVDDVSESQENDNYRNGVCLKAGT